MAVKSWFEEMRECMETGKELEEKRREAIQNEADWRASGEELNLEDDLMLEYANYQMEKELKALGNYIIKKYPDKDDKWFIADTVYFQYGRYYMFANQPAEAVKWFKKAIKDKLPYPYNAWEMLAAAYVETGDYKKADYWIRRYMAHYRSEGSISPSQWMDFSKFYVAVGWFERALAIMLEAKPKQDWLWYDLQEVARAYFGVKNYDKGFELYEAYLQKCSDDDYGFSEIALAYYNYVHDVERSEQHYLKCVEAAASRENPRSWNAKVYDNLSVIFANEKDWDKCFHYLKLHFQNKFQGVEADIFTQIIDQRPTIEDDDMGIGIYHAIKDFEHSPLRPGGLQSAEGLVASQPSEEVSSAHRQTEGISGLFELDESQSN